MTDTMMSNLVWTLSIAALLLCVACLVLVYSVWVLLKKQTEPVVEAETEAVPVKAVAQTAGWLSWSNIRKKLTDAVPVSQEATIDLGHDYDGIRELDNNLPPWWTGGFYVTIAIGFIYLIHFHVFEIGILSPLVGPGVSSAEEYQAEIAAAEEEQALRLAKVANLVDETTVELLTDAGSLSKGEATFQKYCLSCHGAEGQGGIGPNLTDQYWIHGGSINDIFATVKYGVLAKGMQPWKGLLKPTEIQEVSSFIMSLEGTNPPNPKDPQGELYVPSDTTATDSTSIAVIN